MFDIKNVKHLQEKVSGVVRITLLDVDGNETIINVSDDLHYIFGFSKVGPDGGVDIPMELLVHGSADVVGEIFFQAGNRHPELLNHCVKRSTEKIAHKIMDEIKRSGVDPIGEALKKMEPGEKAKWN